LVVPIFHRFDEFGLSQIAEYRQIVVHCAQVGNPSTASLSRGTFMISNLGMVGVDAFSAILNPPQAATLASGTGPISIPARRSESGPIHHARLAAR
jgi:pyruvate dehydrogenase E2 component (dihydrolipoamide acetyltransferase)